MYEKIFPEHFSQVGKTSKLSYHSLDVVQRYILYQSLVDILCCSALFITGVEQAFIFMRRLMS